MIQNDFVGNEKILKQISSWILNNNMPHALVIEGESGLGKSTLANLIAMSIVCRANESKPCMVCSSCKKAKNYFHPDIIFLKPKDVGASIGVGEIRSLREGAYVSPNESEYKIYLIEDIDNMTIQAQNAILKILEELPKHLLFIMTCVSSLSLLPTVRSRVQTCCIEPVSFDDGIKFLLNRDSTLLLDDVKTALESSGGNLGIAIEDLKNDQLYDYKNIAKEIAKAIINTKEINLLDSTSILFKEKNILNNIIDELLEIFRNAYLYANNSEIHLNKDRLNEKIALSFTLKQIFLIVEFLNDSKKYLYYNVNNSLLITWIFSNLYRIKNS